VQPDDTCINVDEACCTGSGGDPEPGDCTEPHACCLPDGTCIVVDPVVCQRDGGDPQAELVCAGDANGNGIDDLCDQPGIPTVSEWGLLVLALLLLTGAKIGYSRNFLGATA